MKSSSSAKILLKPMNSFEGTRPLIIIGAGGHAKVLIDALKLLGAQILGISKKDLATVNTEILGVSIICFDHELERYPSESVALVNGIGGIKDTTLRREVFIRFKLQGYAFSQVIHPAAVISAAATLAEGVQVMAGAVIQAGAKISENAIINTSTSVDHDCHIGSHVHLAPGVTVCGDVKIGDSVHVGSGVTIIQGIIVGPHSLIGAGTLVRENVPAGATVIGVPGRIT
jgi:sugar O-acyltransferase (sialic acid O-acetyltransferase NeuD family)